VRTRLVLAECGELEKYSVLNGAGSLLEDVNALPHSNGIKLSYWEMLKSSRIDRRMKRAIRRLIARDDKRQRLEKKESDYVMRAGSRNNHSGRNCSGDSAHG
jgi:hypothetical protein